MKRYLAIGALVLLAACSTPIINDLAALESGYTAAEVTATQYEKLPACGAAGATKICADPARVAQIKIADNTAFTAISTARAAILKNGTADLAPASAAVAALQSLVSGLVTK